jgi:hypothetical protein
MIDGESIRTVGFAVAKVGANRTDAVISTEALTKNSSRPLCAKSGVRPPSVEI